MKYNTITTQIPLDPKNIKYIWKQPVKIEITDEDGKIHTYDLIKLLDGLTKLAEINETTKGK
ncbi:MAG: hypothetical protein IKY15_01725 [Clostridia bacterium]|nr:hypothetical protein [Clostridia bacterium]